MYLIESDIRRGERGGSGWQQSVSPIVDCIDSEDTERSALVVFHGHNEQSTAVLCLSSEQTQLMAHHPVLNCVCSCNRQ